MSGAKLVDLAARADAPVESCDVCVVGAGAAGSYLTKRLADEGLDVVLLEAGGRTGRSAADAGFDATFAASDYPGATEGRFFGLGGSTSAWGGLLVPHSQHDLRPDADSPGDRHAAAWEHIVGVASRRGADVLRLLGFGEAPRFFEFAGAHLGADLPALEAAGVGVVTSVFLPFRKKNLFHLVDGASATGSPPRVYTRAVAKDWTVGSDGSVRGLVAFSDAGQRVEVRARHFVVAAGAIESARILLEIEAAAPDPISLSKEIGSGLGDHLSVAVADVAPESLARTTRHYAPRFSGPWMRSFRFMESSPPPGTPRAFSHFVFENRNPGFELAKKVLTGIQARRIPRVSPGEALRGVAGVLGLARARYLQSKLFVPSDTPTRLQVDVEQAPDARNRVELGNARDAVGRRVARIDWRISDADIAHLTATADRLLAAWERQGAHLPTLVRRPLDFQSERPHDAYHPVGVCRMGDDGASVVDLGLGVRGIGNLSVVSTAVLPSAGTANPTFTMLCLAEELAGHLARERATAA